MAACRRVAFLLLLTFLLLLQNTQSSSPQTECEKRAPRSLKKAQRELLCRHATTTAPGECAAAARGTRGVSDALIIELCTNAVESAGPGECIAAAPSQMRGEAKIDLCVGAKSTTPAQCATEVRRRTDDITRVALCHGAPSAFPAACFNEATKNGGLSGADAVNLCRGANSVEPATCVTSARLGRLSKDMSADVCRGAESDAPAECIGMAPSWLSKSEQVELCRRARSNMPALCIRLLKGNNRRPNELKVRLCQQALSTAPAECAQQARHNMPAIDKVTLCAGATSTAPAQCVGSVRGIKSEALKIDLCTGAPSTMPAQCVSAAPYSMEPEDKVRLCRGAATTDPAACSKAVHIATGQAKSDSAATAVLCARANSTAPSRCYNSAPVGLDVSYRVDLCRSASSEAPALCATRADARMSPELITSLCRNAAAAVVIEDVESSKAGAGAARDSEFGPLACAAQAPFGFKEKDISRLCHGATSAAPATCASRLPQTLSAEQRAAVCRGAESMAPYQCVHEAPFWMEAQQVVELCRGAKSASPAFCAAATASTFDSGQLQRCRNFVPEPGSLLVNKLLFEGMERGEPLVPKSRIQATVTVLDQFHQPLDTSSTSALVIASMNIEGSNGAQLHGTKSAWAEDGTAFFSDLFFDMSGNFTLKFSVGSAAEAVFVRVGVNTTHFPPTVCGAIFNGLQCYVGNERQESDATTHTVQTALMTGTAVWDGLACGSIMEDAGFRVSRGWNGDLWIWMQPGIMALETGIGLPTPETNHWDRLGVPMGSSRGDVRRAYYRKSLEWHPDRWAMYPEHVARAQGVFELISEAYLYLGSN